MAAGFGWIDFSEEQRDRVNAVIDLLGGSGTIDELGVGIVRDALADWMFPGISTIQTRPRYFIILREILLNYIGKYLRKEKLPELDIYFTEEENRIMNLLAKNHEFKEGHGVIGVTVAKVNGDLARKPSYIYWNGLRVHGLINTHLSRNEYVKAHDYSANRDEDEFEENSELDFGIKGNKLNAIQEDMTMALTKEEASFLRDHFLDTSHVDKNENNLLTEILKDPKRVEIVLSASNFRQAAEVLLSMDDLPTATKAILRIALDFDLLLHGAHIRYNIQLHAKSGTNSFLNEWLNWLQEIEISRSSIERLDFEEVFQKIATRVDSKTMRFMKAWQREVLKLPMDLEVLDKLVFHQEINKKGNKAKLNLKDGEFTSWVGINGLEYRFNIVKNIITDLQVAYA